MSNGMTVADPDFLRWLRVVSLIEGCSTLVLFFVAMPLKYGFGIAAAVTWAGRVHGGLFMALVVMAIVAVKRVPIGEKLGWILIVAAIFPFGPFIVDRRLQRLTPEGQAAD